MSKQITIQSLLDSFFKSKNDEKAGFWNEHRKKSNNEQEGTIQFAEELSGILLSAEENKSGITKVEKDNDYQKLIKNIEKDELFEQSIFKHQPLYTVFLKIAAIILPVFISISAYLFIQNKNLSVTAEEIVSTPKGARSEIQLEDGTTVWLNADSELKYPSSFKGAKKRVVYLSGEAYFDVTKNKKQNFIVYTSDFKIDVLGTSFNVCSYPGDDKVETTLEKGLINIQRIDDNGELKGQNILLKPNQSITLYKESNEIKKANQVAKNERAMDDSSSILTKKKPVQQILIKEDIDTKPFTSWKDDELIFKSMAFKNLIPKLERWYDVNIIIEDEEIYDKTFTGKFEKETLEQAIEALCKTDLYLDFEINKDTVSLTLK